jgi:hypothetical protein
MSAISTVCSAQCTRFTSDQALTIGDSRITTEKSKTRIMVYDSEVHVETSESYQVFRACQVKHLGHVSVYTCEGVEIVVWEGCSMEIVYADYKRTVYQNIVRI